ncbi:MAG: tRNA (adenosine(37)-N6)-threonylcarbamoyltransferase complex dimerization subunit type 1 TsaB [Flavobacteriales bacterium]|nr:tRNA (adenosine(37)-N6)-threonylcarbamoyltransferase complex dimerization subunit type 1 TsaB [Flavobacteriales bacterium]
MALILAIETTTKLCSVALGRDRAVLAQREVETERHAHAEKVNIFIAEVMEEAGIKLADVDAVAVGIGPGSYTGSRIGLSAAKGLCYALDKPIIGVNTLTTLVEAARPAAGNTGLPQWPMIDARRMEVFTQEYDAQGKAMGEVTPLVLDEAWAQAAGACCVFGDGADKAVGLWKSAPHVVHAPGIKAHAWAMLAHAEARLREGGADDLAYLVPLYGKEAKVTQPGKRST